MTKEEFDSISTVEELLDVAKMYDCYSIADYILDEGAREEELAEKLVDMVRSCTSRGDLKFTLIDWEEYDGFEYYYKDPSGEILVLEDDSDLFYELKNELKDFIEDNFRFDRSFHADMISNIKKSAFTIQKL